MAFRTRRQARYSLLRGVGFLPFEAYQLSRVPLRVSYMDTLIKERTKLFKQALLEKWTKQRYEGNIKKKYGDNKWLKQTRAGRIRLDPWQMFRAHEDAYRAKHPEYTSPWQKRRVAFRDFMAKAERTIESHYKDWIRQLDESIAKAETPERKAQLLQQKKNLQSWIK